MRRAVIAFALVLTLVPWVAAQSQQQGQQAVRITNGPVVENVTDSTATVAWSTNVNASSTVRYGTDRNNLDKSAQAPWGGLTHRVTLKNLQPNTTYYFQTMSGEAQGTGTGANSAISQLQTKGAGQNASQQGQGQQGQNQGDVKLVAGPIAQDVTENSASIWWATDRGAETIVKYGTSPNALDKTEQKPWGLEKHEVQLSGLQPGTTYHFQVQKRDGGEYARGEFKTLPAQSAQQLQINNGPVIEHISETMAIVAWSTNRRGSSVVRYGTDQNSLNQTAQAPWGAGGLTHRVHIRNLQPGTKYFFRVESSQAEGTGSGIQASVGQFSTPNQGERAFSNPQPLGRR